MPGETVVVKLNDEVFRRPESTSTRRAFRLQRAHGQAWHCSCLQVYPCMVLLLSCSCLSMLLALRDSSSRARHVCVRVVWCRFETSRELDHTLYFGGANKRHEVTYEEPAQLMRGLVGERNRQAFRSYQVRLVPVKW